MKQKTRDILEFAFEQIDGLGDMLIAAVIVTLAFGAYIFFSPF